MRDIIILLTTLAYSMKILAALTIFLILIASLLLPFIFYFYRRKFHGQRQKSASKGKLVVGIFHPYCNAGGGGEKVLWVALQAMKKKYPKAEFYVYTGDIEATAIDILQKVKKNLNVDLEGVKFVYLTRRKWVEGSTYKHFTLLGQAFGSIYLGFEAIKQLNPDIYMETTGFAFTLPLFKYLGGCKTASYVHYPTITTQMLRRVYTRQTHYANNNSIARSPFLTAAKLIYYQIFAWFYSLAGNCSDITLVNSTFTLEHLNNMWNKPLHLVYPPCEVEHLKKLQRQKTRPENIRILSLAQFRPEKDHPLQLQALYELREQIHEDVFSKITLVLCGSCRNSDDTNRVKDLQDLSKHLSLENNVEFKVNIPYEELLEEYKKASIGIHTMADEHFGISVVEQMAAGLIMVAHRSGGPLLDIIETSEGSRLGFLAITAQQFAYTLQFILECSDEEIEEIREKAKASVERFSVKKFQDEFLRATEPLFK